MLAPSALERSALAPPLKWAGGKRWLLPYLVPLWQPYADRRLVEPFAGGLAVTLGLRPQRALCNDINPHLINFYRWIARGLKPWQIDVPLHYDAHTYSINRARFNALIAQGKHDNAETALLLYYLNRSGYNGLYRVSSSGRFNVPFGKHRSVQYRQDFSDYQREFANYTFTVGDFSKMKIERSDFIYADPPYDQVDFTSYARDGFTWDDQQRLAYWLADHRGPVIASNHATSRIMRLYRSLGFRTRILNAPRRISCTGDRRPAREMLAVRNLA
jgi:DNA adenine methylase